MKRLPERELAAMTAERDDLRRLLALTLRFCECADGRQGEYMGCAMSVWEWDEVQQAVRGDAGVKDQSKGGTNG